MAQSQKQKQFSFGVPLAHTHTPAPLGVETGPALKFEFKEKFSAKAVAHQTRWTAASPQCVSPTDSIPSTNKQQKAFSAQSTFLTCQIYHLLRLHHIQSKGLQVPEVLLQHWILKTVTPVKTTSKHKHFQEEN